MDPVTAIGLVSGILSFIDFGTRIVRGANHIYESKDGTPEDNKTMESAAIQMQQFSAELSDFQTSGPNIIGNDGKLCELAVKCKGIADEVHELLEKIKAKDPKSRTQTLWSALKDERYRGKKEELGKRLDACRSQFHLQLDYFTSKTTLSQLRDILQTSASNATQIQKLQTSIRVVHETMQHSVLSNSDRDRLEQFLRAPNNILESIAEAKILKRLGSSEINRLNDINPAHARTFEWLFSDGEISNQWPVPEDSMKNHEEYRQELDAREIYRKRFTEWLSSGHGVFHFFAKLGAGKSTLMKLVYKHETVRKRLNDWASAGNRELVCGGFFFWNKGETYQKELRGMYRGLLCSVLKSHRELIPKLLPSCWAEALSTPWQVQMDEDISDKDTKEAFECLVNETANSGKYRLFILIDGLDEMEVATDHTYRHLVQILNSWTDRGSSNMKLCISSRQDIIFRDNISKSQRLHLHHVTKLDMQQVARERLSLVLGTSDVDKIANAIVDKAQGIFFWVVLVITNILQLEDGATTDERLEPINQLPDGLFELFNRILKSLDLSTRICAYKTLAMIQEGDRWNNPVPAIGYCFLAEWTKKSSPDFSMRHVIAEDFTANTSPRCL